MNTTLPNVGQRNRKRHPDNPALKLFWECRYQDMRVLTHEGPLIENYLEILLRVMNQARQDCPRIFAVRIDLLFPAEGYMGYSGCDNACATSFISHLLWELDVANTKYPHKMRYTWCREQVSSIHHHYHVLLLLNGQAYKGLGYFGKSHGGGFDRDNLYHRIVRAWSSAIAWPLEDMGGLVNVATDSVTEKKYLWNFYQNDQAAFAEVFYGASYMCKAYSKPIKQGFRCFDGSRR